jgi:hypothetical protein
MKHRFVFYVAVRGMARAAQAEASDVAEGRHKSMICTPASDVAERRHESMIRIPASDVAEGQHK